VRAIVPRVRIPLSPLSNERESKSLGSLFRYVSIRQYHLIISNFRDLHPKNVKLGVFF